MGLELVKKMPKRDPRMAFRSLRDIVPNFSCSQPWKSKLFAQSLSEHVAKSLQKLRIILLPGELLTSTNAFSFFLLSGMKPGMISLATSSMPSSMATIVLERACSRQ